MAAVSYTDAKKILLLEHNMTRHALNWRIELTCINDRIAVLYLGCEILIISRRSNDIGAALAVAQSIMAEEPISALADLRVDIIAATLPQPIAEDVIAAMRPRKHITTTTWSIRHDCRKSSFDAYARWCCVWEPQSGWRAIMAGEYVEYSNYRRAYSFDSFKEWIQWNF